MSPSAIAAARATAGSESVSSFASGATLSASRRTPNELMTPIFSDPFSFGNASRNACAASGAGMRSRANRAMWARSLSDSRLAKVGTEAAVPMIISLRQAKSLASRETSVFNTAASRFSRSFRAAASVVRSDNRLVDFLQRLAIGSPIVGFQSFESLIQHIEILSNFRFSDYFGFGICTIFNQIKVATARGERGRASDWLPRRRGIPAWRRPISAIVSTRRR